jgi:hypothetical protein
MAEARSTRCVLLFSRSPLRDERLKRIPGSAAVFELARRRVADAVGSLAGVDLILVGDGPAPDGIPVLPQVGSTFGERLANAFADAARLGYGEVVAVPSDVPSLQPIALSEAFHALGSASIGPTVASTVLGPSPDGGVYLIGITGDAAPVLRGIRWQTRHVAKDLSSRIAELGWASTLITTLPPLCDIDERSDLRALARAAGTDAVLCALIRRILASFSLPSERVRTSDRQPSRRVESARGPPRARLAA